MPVPRRFDRQPPERDQTRINERIRVAEVRLVDEDGSQIGVVKTDEALAMAAERDLDLVEVAPDSRPPVARLLDYSKYKYEQEQKAKAARKHQQQVNVREIKLRPKIADHDYETKKGHVERFLRHQDKVKVTIMFRGREQAHPERGRALLERLFEDVAELATIEQQPQQEGRNMHMLLAPSDGRAPPARAEERRGERRPRPPGRTGRGRHRPARPPPAPRSAEASDGRRCRAPRRRAASASIVGPMPKMKTHSGAKKRFRKTATGKLRGRRAYSIGWAVCPAGPGGIVPGTRPPGQLRGKERHDRRTDDRGGRGHHQQPLRRPRRRARQRRDRPRHGRLGHRGRGRRVRRVGQPRQQRLRHLLAEAFQVCGTDAAIIAGNTNQLSVDLAHLDRDASTTISL